MLNQTCLSFPVVAVSKGVGATCLTLKTPRKVRLFLRMSVTNHPNRRRLLISPSILFHHQESMKWRHPMHYLFTYLIIKIRLALSNLERLSKLRPISLLQVSLAAILLTGLTGCTALTPSHRVVEQALSIQIGQVQAELGQQLKLSDQWSGFTISHLVVTEQSPLTIEGLPGYRLRGTYDYTLKSPKREITRQQNPFELYLQRQKENKTWRLARPVVSETNELAWVTQRLPFLDE